MKKREKPKSKSPAKKFVVKKGASDKRSSKKPPFKKKFNVVRKDGSAVNAKKRDDGLMRLNRFISHSGICSRREADDLITAGVVKVNGKVVTELGTRVDPKLDRIHYEDSLLKGEKLKYLLMNKPKGFISTVDDPRKKKTVMDLIGNGCKERIAPVGRLDRTETGVLLMTNDEELSRKLSHPTKGVKQVYSVSLNKEVTIGQLRKLREGISLEDGIAKVDKVDYSGKNKRDLGLEISMGKNRIVRRMFDNLGLEVMKLDRVLFAGLTKKNLPKGNWRFLSQKEVEFLQMF